MYKQHFHIIFCLGVLFFLYPISSSAQTDSLSTSNPTNDSIVVGHSGLDERYLEDQFYAGLSFNLLSNLPKGVSQSGFSGGMHFGWIKDIPLTTQRNFALGIGLGWSMDSYRSNLLITQDEKGNGIYQILDSDNYDYDLNRFMGYLVEMPLQFRWRTSTASSYKFWRIYAGLRIGYMYYFRSKFKQAGQTISLTDVEGLNRWRYGATFTFGYNTFNFTVYYSLNPFFDAQTIDGQDVGMSTFKVGITFFIL